MLKETESRYADEIEELKLKAEELRANLEKTKTKRDKELKSLRKAADAERQNDCDCLDKLIKTYEADVSARMKEDEIKIAQIKRDERAELSGAGADTTMTDGLQNEIDMVRSKIDRIEKERDVVVEYRNDCKRLLDHEDDFKSQKKDFEDADAALKQTYDGKYQKLELKRTEEKTALLELNSSLDRALEAIQKTNDFVASSACPPELKEANSISTELECLSIVETIRNLTGEIYRLSDSLKSQINEFQKRFSSNWTENLKAVGSEGTDILVKAIMNILLVSVFKRRAGQAGDFRLHCMMDEIGRLADENIQGILNFANERDIFIVNSSPKAHRPLSYRHLYMLSKDKDAHTIVQPILSTRQANRYED